MPQPALLITDPDCGFCQRSAGWLESKFSGNWRNSPSHSDLLQEYGITAEQAQQSVWLVEFDSAGTPSRSAGAAAVARVVAMHGGIWRAAKLFAYPPLVWLAQPVYKLIARNRHRLPGATAACELPRRR